MLCASGNQLTKAYFHCERQKFMILQKLVEQMCRSVHCNSQNSEITTHSFDDEMNFSWSQITAHRAEKSFSESY